MLGAASKLTLRWRGQPKAAGAEARGCLLQLNFTVELLRLG